MTRKLSKTATSLTVASLLLAAGGLQAEVKCGDPGCSWLVVVGITEEPDPITTLWDPVPETLQDALDPGAEGEDQEHGDIGPPSVVYQIETGWPVVLWSQADPGLDYDVRFSEWTGESWTDAETIGATAADELDPKVVGGDDGTLYAVWWQTGEPDLVFLSIRKPNGPHWSSPEPIGYGRRPSLIVQGREVMIAFESQGIRDGQEVIVVTKNKNSKVTEILAWTGREASLDVEISHDAELGEIWMDWRHEENAFGYSQLREGVWVVDPVYQEATASPFGIETVRRSVLHLLFGWGSGFTPEPPADETPDDGGGGTGGPGDDGEDVAGPL